MVRFGAVVRGSAWLGEVIQLSRPFDKEKLEAAEAWTREHFQFLPVKLPQPADLLRLHELAEGLALHIQDEHASLPGQIWIVCSAAERPLVVLTRWDNPKNRAHVLNLMHGFINEPAFEVTRYAVMSEGYSVVITPMDGETIETAKKRRDASRPARYVDDPESIEVLWILCTDRKGEKRGSSFHVTRDPQKGDSAPPVSRVRQTHTDVGNYGGDLISMFDEADDDV